MALADIAGLRGSGLAEPHRRDCGATGITNTALVATDIVTGVFRLGSIVWFTWLGMHMLRAARTDSEDVL